MAAFALASSSSISSSMGQTMSGAKLASRNRSLCGLLPCYSSEEFQPKARLIVPAESLVLNGDNDDAMEHWGHFADFDTIEDEDVMIPVPLSDRFQLDTLDENEDEDEH